MFERNCGATEDYSTKVALTYPAQEGNLDRWLLLDVDGRVGVNARWISSSQLEVTVPVNARIGTFVAVREDISIQLVRKPAP